MRYATLIGVLGCSVMLLTAGAARAEKLAKEYQEAVNKGLDWLARNQYPDGHWDGLGKERGGGNGQYPTTMTALAGMAMLMDGSTMREGKYASNIKLAANWFLERSQSNGLLGNPSNPTEAMRYMYGHGFGMLFLASVYGEEEDAEMRKKLEGVLTRGVLFTGRAQTDRGGWGYVSAKDGQGFDEGSVTITQMQGLRAARNAGIPVPPKIIDNAKKYLSDCTTEDGGVIYSLAQGGRAMRGGERPPLTAAAIACSFASGEYDSKLAKKWISFCRTRIPLITQGNRFGHDEYTHYYYAQALYILGDDRYGKLFPKSNQSEWLTWSNYRKGTFEALLKLQDKETGRWEGSGNWGHIGPVYATAVFLTIMQLDKGVLPIYMR
jgi:hypothetical protein